MSSPTLDSENTDIALILPRDTKCVLLDSASILDKTYMSGRHPAFSVGATGHVGEVA